MRFSWWLFFAIACSTTPPAQMALDKQVRLDKALAACASLDSTQRQGQCALDALTVREKVTLARCLGVPGERWRNECLFQAAERSTDSLAARYAICKQAGDFERDCGFHLWQQDLMDLKPGQPGQSGMLIVAAQLMRKHRPFAEPLDYRFEETYWTWFWGAWWEQQVTATDAACDTWTDPAEKERCRTWRARATRWREKREQHRPQ
jgi:hypothetical protein